MGQRAPSYNVFHTYIDICIMIIIIEYVVLFVFSPPAAVHFALSRRFHSIITKLAVIHVR